MRNQKWDISVDRLEGHCLLTAVVVWCKQSTLEVAESLATGSSGKTIIGVLMILTILVSVSFILGVRVICSLIRVGVFAYKNKEDETFDKLNYKEHKKLIVEEIDKFYHDRQKIDNLLRNKKLLYRKAQLTNMLNEKTALRDSCVSLVISLFCTVASCYFGGDGFAEIFEDDTVNKSRIGCGIVIVSVIVLAILYLLIQIGMENVKTEAYKYELEYISRAVSSHIDISLVPDKVITVERKEKYFGKKKTVSRTTRRRTVRYS